MTVNLNCRIAFANQGMAQTDAGLADIEAFLKNQFLAGSQGHINLQFLPTMTISGALPAGKPVSARLLHQGLIESNRNPPLGPVTTISVLMASSYETLGAAFGMMFDRGFTTDDDQNTDPQFLAAPRQGCAVFVDTISSQRPNGFAEEVWYTAAHELGHVFNLQHNPSCEAVPTCMNFMRVSGSQTYDPGAFHFATTDQNWLAQCDTDPNVMPGDSIFGSGSAFDTPARRRFHAMKALHLQIELAKNEAWRFQPLQLGVTVSVADADGSPVVIPELLDPASDGFRIFIEDDRRERRLYNSPVRTCGMPAVVTVGPGKPFTRDLPIFGEAGGYTFRKPGVHRIWAEFDIGRHRLTSNVVELYVRPEIAMPGEALHARAVLKQSPIGSLLFHREDHPDHAALRVLAHALSANPDMPGAAEIGYSIGSALLRSQRTGRELNGVDLPSAFFAGALKQGGLLDHQLQKAEEGIAESDRLAVSPSLIRPVR